MSWEHLDESDVRIRPNPRGSRPRSKDRPKHEAAYPALVVGVDRGRYTCLVDAGIVGRREPERMVVAMRARELGRSGIVVGDDVALVGDVSGAPGALARIVRVERRRGVLRRSAEDTDSVERAIVANADQLAIVSALANPEPRPRLIDRCLVAAFDAGMAPLLVLTKADLVDPADFLAQYAPLDVPYVVLAVKTDPPAGLAELRTRRGETAEAANLAHQGDAVQRSVQFSQQVGAHRRRVVDQPDAATALRLHHAHEVGVGHRRV